MEEEVETKEKNQIGTVTKTENSIVIETEKIITIIKNGEISTQIKKED